MKKFQYKTVACQSVDIDTMDWYGQNGWELVQCLPSAGPNEMMLFIFKRER